MTILSGVKLKLYPNKTQKQTIEQTLKTTIIGTPKSLTDQLKNS